LNETGGEIAPCTNFSHHFEFGGSVPDIRAAQCISIARSSRKGRKVAIGDQVLSQRAAQRIQ